MVISQKGFIFYFINLCILFSLCLFVCLFACLTGCLLARMSVCSSSSVCSSPSVCLFLSVCLSVSVSLSFSVSLSLPSLYTLSILAIYLMAAFIVPSIFSSLLLLFSFLTLLLPFLNIIPLAFIFDFFLSLSLPSVSEPQIDRQIISGIKRLSSSF